MCCNHAYLIPGQEDQYVVNWKKLNTHLKRGNACWDGGYAHIFATAMSAAIAYIWRSCGITEFYMSQIDDYSFNQTLCLLNFDFDRWSPSNNDHTVIVIMNEYFCQICSTYNHKWPCTVHTSYWVGVEALILV